MVVHWRQVLGGAHATQMKLHGLEVGEPASVSGGPSETAVSITVETAEEGESAAGVGRVSEITRKF